MDGKTRRFFDLVLILFLLAAGGSALAARARNSGAESIEGAIVLVQVEGQPETRYPLDQNGVYPLNGGTNTLTIADGYAWMSGADCPDHLCVYQGKIHREGEWIICLPNRVAVTIEGGGA